MISIINNKYVVQLPEHGVYQDIDPATGQPFADEATAQSWEAAFIARMTAHAAEIAAGQQVTLAALLRIEVVPSHAEVAVGQMVTLVGTVENGLDQVVPLNDYFCVPIENEKGEVIMIKRVEFIDGVASVSFSPTRSGYYYITEEGVNRRLPSASYLRLPESVEVVVYE